MMLFYYSLPVMGLNTISRGKGPSGGYVIKVIAPDTPRTNGSLVSSFQELISYADTVLQALEAAACPQSPEAAA